MKLVQCDSSQRNQWNEFVGRSPAASFYHLFEWRDVNRECFGHRTANIAAFDGETVVGVFPIVQLKSRLFGNIACSLPFVNYGGPCADGEDIERALVHEAARVVDRWGVDYLEIRSRKHLGPDFATSDHKVSLTVELKPDPDELWNAFKTGHRQAIRRGYKNGFKARVGGPELMDDFYSVLAESWRDLGTPLYPRRYLQSIAASFGERIRICVVYAGDEPAAAAFDGVHGDTVEGMWLGTRARYRDQLVGYVLYWELIKSACEKGLARFHLGRSTAHSGAETFKRKWNATSAPLYWHYLLRATGDIPHLNVANPKYRLAIRAWQHLPVAVTRVIGPAIARAIP